MLLCHLAIHAENDQLAHLRSWLDYEASVTYHLNQFLPYCCLHSHLQWQQGLKMNLLKQRNVIYTIGYTLSIFLGPLPKESYQ